jgi:hypothetical protein
MRYISTRDTRPPSERASFSFIDTVLLGLAPDGGLLVPETSPAVLFFHHRIFVLFDRIFGR